MKAKRTEQLEQMLERGTIRKGHIAEMLAAIKQPPQREWVGLTDDEQTVINRNNVYVYEIIKATEAKLKEKNT